MGLARGAVLTGLGLCALANCATGASHEVIDPSADWCEALGRMAPGGELVLRPGDYAGPCRITHGGAPQAPIVIRALDPSDPPRIVYGGSTSNVVEVHASHVVLRGLRFGPTAPDVDAVRIIEGHDITVEGNAFVGLGGIAVVANHTSTRGIVVRGNTITGSRATAMYFGCHDGRGCRISDLLIEGNYIRGVQAAEHEVGYGIQVKLNSSAVIRDNVIVDTKGPGIMVYGATDLARVSVVERNFVAASRTSSAIVVGGGPAVVRNNVAASCAEAGIGIENYGERGLLRSIVVAHNTVYDNARGGILVPEAAPLGVRILNNLVHARPGTAAVPPRRPGVETSGNAACVARECFRDPLNHDFSPLLMPLGLPINGPWAPSDDFFGRPRGTPPIAGALEGAAPPIPLEARPVR